METSKPRWPMFYAVHSRAQLLDDMLTATSASLRIAVGMRRGEAFMEARTSCISCAHSRNCRRWLDEHSSECGSQSPPAWCPNSQFIQLCRSGSPASK